MIKATVQQVRDAYRAFTRINEEVRLPQKPAWRVARLLGQLKPVVRSFEETQLKLFKNAGGVQGDRGISIPALEREEGEPAADWKGRQDERRELINELNDEIKRLNDEEVEINYDPIPISLFEDEDKTPPEKRRQFSANDFADAGPFLVEDEKK